MNDNNQFVALTRCFYCGEPDRLLLHRRLRDISEAHGKVLDYEPCPKCAELMKQGVMFIVVRDGEEGKENPYRTGQMCVIRDSAVERMLKPGEMRDKILKKRVCFLPQAMADAMGLPKENIDNTAKNEPTQK